MEKYSSILQRYYHVKFMSFSENIEREPEVYGPMEGQHVSIAIVIKAFVLAHVKTFLRSLLKNCI